MASRSCSYLFTLRFYSGLSCLREGVWRPTGSPAIYKLLEGLNAKQVPTTILFFCKTHEENVGLLESQKVTVQELPYLTFILIPWKAYTTWSRLDVLLNDLMHMWKAGRIVAKEKPALLYVDRSHLFLGAWFTRRGIPVVVRMLGVAPFVSFFARTKNRYLHPLQTHSFRSRFAYVICSRDGSGTAEILSRWLHPKTPYAIWLNGVDDLPISSRKEAARVPRILFVGRFEEDKGALEFVQAIKCLREMYRGPFEAVMVGSGSYDKRLRSMIDEDDLADCLTCEGSLSHSEIRGAYQNADIYVSLNKKGNLSNTVLEALQAGLCTMVLRGEGVIDEDTARILPERFFPRVERSAISESLATQLAMLLESPEEVAKYAQAARSAASSLLVAWDARIEKEIQLLQKIAQR